MLIKPQSKVRRQSEFLIRILHLFRLCLFSTCWHHFKLPRNSTVVSLCGKFWISVWKVPIYENYRKTSLPQWSLLKSLLLYNPRWGDSLKRGRGCLYIERWGAEDSFERGWRCRCFWAPQDIGLGVSYRCGTSSNSTVGSLGWLDNKDLFWGGICSSKRSSWRERRTLKIW